MNIFVDGAHISDITPLLHLGIVHGCTTNPSIIKKEGVLHLKEHIQELCTLIDGPVSVETNETSWEGMVEDGKTFATWSPHVVVKVPMGAAGLRATHELNKLHIPVNVTLIFNSAQAVLAAHAGATYISPFLGRINDMGMDGIQVIKEIMELWSIYDLETQVLAASIRDIRQFQQCGALGVDCITVPPTLLKTFMDHPLTTLGIEKFQRDSTL